MCQLKFTACFTLVGLIRLDLSEIETFQILERSVNLSLVLQTGALGGGGQ